MQGGILLGPSALGRWNAFRRTLFPDWSTAALDTVSGLGLLLFLFLVGLELDFGAVRRVGPRSVAIAAAGIVPPLLAAAGIVPLLDLAVPAPRHASYFSLCVFLGAALSVTALPVLACILKELGLLGVSFGETAMAAAAVNDVFAWALLALALAVSGGGREPKGPPLAPVYILASGALFVAFTFFALRPLMARLARHTDPDGGGGDLACSSAVACALLSGAVTDAIGVHPVFGAFVFGLAMPRECGVAERTGERVAPLVSGLMLPLYFATSGLHTDVDSVRGVAAWGMVALVVAVAVAGKFTGTFAVAVAGSGMARREAAALGVAMSAKGLVELIVLNIGKEKKVSAATTHECFHWTSCFKQTKNTMFLQVLDDTTFAIFVIMALTTTVVATPLMTALYRQPPTATTPESGGVELKGGDVCQA